MKTCARLLLVVLSGLLDGQAMAASEWFWQGNGSVVYQDYQGAHRHRYLLGVGALAAGEYLDRGGFKLGYNYRHKNFIASADQDPQDLDANFLHLSGHGHFYPSLLHGRLTLRMDIYLGRDEYHYLVSVPDPVLQPASRDNVLVLNPHVAFLNAAKTRYFDLGYAYSRYRSTVGVMDNLYLHQWTPALGVGFNRDHDWLQLRGIYIHLSPSQRVAEKDSTTALEVAWRRKFGSAKPLGVSSFTLTLLAGERVYAVDSDARVVHAEGDLQKGGLTLAVQWKLEGESYLRLQGGYARYQDTASSENYSGTGVTATLSRRW